MSDDRTPSAGSDREPDDAVQHEPAAEQARDDAAHEVADEPAQDVGADEPTHDAGADDSRPVDLATDVTATDREAAANEAAERARALQPRAVGLWGARAAAGLAAIALGGLVVLSGAAAPSATTEPRIEQVSPDAPVETRVCAGPLLGLGDASGDADAIPVLAQPERTASAEEESALAIDGVDATIAQLRGPSVAGAESLAIETDVARGTAASECVVPATTQWLVGGATTTGRSSVLTIANPGRAATTVDVRVYGPEGEVATVGSTGIAIAPGSTTVLDLAALAPGLTSPVVHVVASGGPVAAHLQQTVVRTLQPGGVDVADPTQASTSLAIPGVVIGDATGLQTQPGFADAAPALRILAGTTTQATVTTIADGSEPIVSTLDLVGGEVQEIDLTGLAPGTYAFRVEADVPLVAGARQVRIDGDRVDLDWIAAAAAPLESSTTVAIAPGQSPRLHVLNVSDAPATVVVGGQEIELPVDGLRTVPVEAGPLVVDGSGIVAAVTFSGSDGIAGTSLTPPVAARSSIRVVL